MNPSVLATLEARWRTQTLALGPTPLDQAEDRLEFFAAAVQLYDQRGWPMPPTLDALREQLRSIEFAVVRREDDVTRTYRGSDDSLYGFSDGRGNDRRFAFQKPARPDLPPEISAPGLSPEPMLQWSRDRDGTLTHQLVYR